MDCFQIAKTFNEHAKATIFQCLDPYLIPDLNRIVTSYIQPVHVIECAERKYDAKEMANAGNLF